MQRNALFKQRDEYLQNVCLDGKDACDKAKAEIRQENGQLFGEDCPRNLKSEVSTNIARKTRRIETNGI
jgi:hypothetical protein